MINELKEIGLSENEAKIYTSLLQLGPTTTGPIIKKTGLYRVIVYDTLEKLLKLGLVNYSLKKNRKQFEAEDPKQIIELIKNKEVIANSIIKELENLKRNKKIEQGNFIYEGWKGIKAAQENYLKEAAKGEYLMVGASKELHEKLDVFFNYFHERRSKLKIPAKLLFNANNKKFAMLKKKYKPVEIRFMPKDVITPSWISTYQDMVLIGIADDPPTAFFIKNKSVADSYKQYFYFMWNKSKK